MKDYIELVAKNVNFKDEKNIIEKFLVLLYLKSRLSTKSISEKLQLPIPIITAIKKEFIKLNILEQMNGVCITQLGIEYLNKYCGYEGVNKNLFSDLLWNEYKRKEFLLYLEKKYQHIFSQRPQVDVKIDQAKSTAYTSFKRALLCLQDFSLIGKKILCVGDDDLVSVAIVLLLKELSLSNNQFTKICVFDIDKRFLDYIKEISHTYSYDITCECINLKEPLPLKYSNIFDCFFTDPPYTINGLDLFLSRGLSALKKEKGLSVFLSFGNKPIQESFDIQNHLNEFGLIIKEIFHDFNSYEGASVLGSTSQMMILKSTEHIIPIIERQYNHSIYTKEQNKYNSIYKCKKCNFTIELNKKNKFSTIEDLKNHGCPKCGNVLFEQLKRKYVSSNENKRQSLGVHLIIDYYGCNPKIISETKKIKNIMHEAAKKSNSTIVTEEFHEFQPYGVSGAIIIQESHFTIHTWPEYNYAAVDLFSCGDSVDLNIALNYIKKCFESDKYEYTNVKRGFIEDKQVSKSIFNKHL